MPPRSGRPLLPVYCLPSRISLVTGHWPLVNGHFFPSRTCLERSRENLSEGGSPSEGPTFFFAARGGSYPTELCSFRQLCLRPTIHRLPAEAAIAAKVGLPPTADRPQPTAHSRPLTADGFRLCLPSTHLRRGSGGQAVNCLPPTADSPPPTAPPSTVYQGIG